MAAMKKEDRLKETAERILGAVDSGRLRGVYASVAAIQEIVFWFYNRQLLHEMVQAVNILTHLRNIEWVELTPEICLTASVLMDEHKVSPFDAYHVATAISRDKVILSTEHVYDQIEGTEKIDPRELLGKL